MHAHESQAPGFQPQAGVNQVNPLAPRPFEVTFPGQEVAAAPTNPFVQRSANAWATPPAAPPLPPAAPTPEGETDAQDVQLDWRPQFNLFAEGQPPPNPPRRWGIQAKLTIGRPNDAYEQEADRVAAQVMTMPNPIQRLQRQHALGAEAAEEIQPKRLAETITPLVQRQELPEDDTPVQAKCANCEQEETAPEETVQRSPNGVPQVQTNLESTFVQAKCEACEQEETVQRSPNGVPQVQTNLEEQLNASKGGGSPLSEDVRSFMEPRFGADFSQVRVHTGNDAVQMSQEIGAQAFTHGSDVYYGTGKTPGVNELTAHELTHVVQQTGSLRRKSFTQTAQAIATQPETGKPDVRPKTLNTLHLISRKPNASSTWLTEQQADGTPTTAPKSVDSLQPQPRSSGSPEAPIQRKSILDDVIDFGEEAAWMVVGEIAPELEPILKKGAGGVFDWIKNLIGSSIEGVFNTMMTPVRSIAGIDNQLKAQFAPILASLQTVGGQLARNDCTPISDAAAKLEKIAGDLITPVVEKLQPIVTTIKNFLSGLWEKIGAPIWGWIKDYAGEQWRQLQWLGEQLQKFASWIWKTTGGDKMWTWLKNKLGIGEGVEGQDGLLQWVQRKVEAAWAALKAKLEPFQQELTTIGVAVGAVAVAVSPAGPVLALGAAVYEAVQGFRWIAANWGKGNLIVKARTYIQKSLIPSLQGAATRLGATFKQIAGTISSALNNFAAGMLRAVGAINGSLLRMATSAVQWLANQAKALADWADQQLNSLSQWLEEALNKLQAFLTKMLDFFMELGRVVLDIWLLPAFLGKEVWTAIPQCIRDPVIDFIGPIILRQIEIFQALAQDKDAWQKTKADVVKIVHLVFTDRDLMGAIRATFDLILRVFNVPPELLVTIAQKAQNAWDVVSKDPINFIKNIVRTVGHGFRLLWKNLGEHLKFGLTGWLTGGLAENNITLPSSWSDPRQVFGFVLDVLGLSMSHVWELIEKKVEDKEKVKKLRKRFEQVTSVIDWIFKAIDITKSPAENTAGIIEQVKNFGSSILTGVAEWVAGKVAEELAILAAAAAASGGLSEVLDLIRRIYKAIVTAVRWARRILDMVNETLTDITAIASGNVEAAGAKLEQIMHNGMPVVIGFLADQVGLGDIGTAINNIITPLREKVDEAINWLIDKIKAGIEALVGAVKAGVAAIKDWWAEREEFTADDGEHHSLYFRGQDEQAKLTIASTPEDYETFISKIRIEGQSDEFKAAREQALVIAQEISQKQAERTFDDEAREKKAQFIRKKLNALSKPTKILASLTTSNKPPSVVSYGSLTSEGGAISMNASILSKNHVQGSSPADNPSIWQNANRRAGIFVQGHLLNDNLGGPGRMYNLTPITRSANAMHHAQIEDDVKSAVNEGQVVRYKVTVKYNGHPRRSTYKDLKKKVSDLKQPRAKDLEKLEIMKYEEKYLATSLEAEWAILEKRGSEWVDKEKKSAKTIPNELPDELPEI